MNARERRCAEQLARASRAHLERLLADPHGSAESLARVRAELATRPPEPEPETNLARHWQHVAG